LREMFYFTDGDLNKTNNTKDIHRTVKRKYII